jgi:hypothetical protein
MDLAHDCRERHSNSHVCLTDEVVDIAGDGHHREYDADDEEPHVLGQIASPMIGQTQ